MKKRKGRRSVKIIVSLLLIAAVVTAVSIGVFSYLQDQHLAYLKEITPVAHGNELESEISDPLPSAAEYFGYLGAFDEETATVRYTNRETGTGYVPAKDAGLPLGVYDVSLFCDGVEGTFSGILRVVDKTPPVLTLKDITVKYGEKFEKESFVESCTDNTDEDCSLSFAILLDEKEVAFPTPNDPGKYTVAVTATDPSGNMTKATASLTIGEKPKPAVPAKSKYSISINRTQNTVTVFKLDESNNYQPYKAMVCSTGGSKTPLGSFNLGARYEWLSLYGGVYGQYTVRIHGSIAFHSAPYFTQDKSDLEYEEYNKLGTVASAGCVRLCVRDVKWIYDNCAPGTPVTIYDGNDPGPLGKPTPLTIDPSSPNRGWDPTDPDPNNPW